MPPTQLLRLDDLDLDALAGEAVLLQLQQPADVVLAAAAAARAVCVADGTPADDSLLQHLDLLRADETETQQLADGRELRAVAEELLDAGLSLVLLTEPGATLAAWREGSRARHATYPWLDLGPEVDPTGAGDAAVAALVDAWLQAAPPDVCARRAVAASALSLAHAGGRPRLTRQALEEATAQVTARHHSQIAG